MFRSRGFIFRKTVVYTVVMVFLTCINISSLVGRSVCVCVCSKHLEDIKIANQNSNLENVHFVGLCCIIV